MKLKLLLPLLFLGYFASAQWSTSPPVTTQTRKVGVSQQIRWIWGSSGIYSITDTLGGYFKLVSGPQTSSTTFPSSAGSKKGIYYTFAGAAFANNQTFIGAEFDNRVTSGSHTGISIFSATFDQSTNTKKHVFVGGFVSGRFWKIPTNDTIPGYVPYLSIKDSTNTPFAKFHALTGDVTIGNGADTVDMTGVPAYSLRVKGIIRAANLASTGAVSGLAVNANGDFVKTGLVPTLSGNNHFTGVDTIDNLTVTNTATIHTADVNSLHVQSPDILLNGLTAVTSIPAGEIRLPFVIHAGLLQSLHIDTIANYIFGHNEVYDIVICLGQSNMQGKGNYLQSPASIPGNYYYLNGALHLATNPIYGYLASSAYKGDMLTSFGNTYYQTEGRHIILINLAVSSTALIHTNDTGAGHWDNSGTSLTTTSIAKVNTMLDSLRNNLHIKIGKKMILWGQGEQDGYPTYLGTTTANAYRDTLISVFQRFRAAIDPAMHCYIVRTGAWNNAPDPDYYITVRNAQESVPAKDSLSYVVARGSVEFPALGFMSPSAPTVHYNQLGQNENGRQAALDLSQNLHKTAYFLGDMIYFDGVRMGRNSKLQFDSVYKAIHLGVLPTVPSMDTVSVTSAGKNAGIVIERFGTGGSNSGRISFFNSRGTSNTSALPIQAGDYLGGFLVYGNYGTGTATYNAAASVGLRGIAVDNFTSGAMGAGLVATVIPIGTTTPVTALNIYPAGGAYFANSAMSSIAIQTHLFAKNSGADSASSVFDGGTVPASMWRNNTYPNYNRVTMFMNSNTDATLDATLALKINTTNNAAITLGSGQLAIKSTVTAGVLHSAVTSGNITTGQVQSADIASGAVSLTKIANQPANTIIGNNTGSSASLAALTVSQVNTMLGFSTTAAQTYTFPGASQTLASLAGTETFTNKTITSSTNKIGGVTMQLGSDATGDIHYSGASNVLTRLAIGSTGQVLKVAGGVPSWSAQLTYLHTIFTPTTGGTVTLVNNQYNIINPAGALLALTVNLPSSPANNDVVFIKFTQNVTTVTYANGTVVDGITAPSAGGLTVLTYDSGTTSWY